MPANGAIEVIALESDPATRFAMYRTLTGAGIQRVRLATSADHVVALARATRPDLFLLDTLAPEGWQRILTTVREATAPPAPSEASDHGIGSGDFVFAGDLDELLGGGDGKRPVGTEPIATMLMAGQPTRELVAAARSMEVAGILLKPLRPENLAARLRAAIRQGARETWSV